MSEQKGSLKTALANVDTAGGIFSILNPEEAALIITKMIVVTTVVATAACTLDAGVGSGATTNYDTLIDGLDLNGAIGVFDNVDDQGTNGKVSQSWPSGEYVTGSAKSGASAGLVGYVYIEYIRA